MSTEKVIELLKNDKHRLAILDCVYRLPIKHAYVGAGFVRNMVWDHLHDLPQSTELTDIDVIYFDCYEPQEKQYQYEQRLNAMMANVNWQVRNQAYMHLRNKDKAYQNLLDAMSYWPEKETAVAIRKLDEARYECISAFSLASLFNLQLSYNPKRPLSVFQQRVADKQWLQKWPKLRRVI
ncbi:nucleotidyltransferase family protein [Litorilituus sediminis]|uniref:Nucleotidyltransferase family protein n=1 Tax=Litorilituus sediminis TaxID=718192 RepID=A0A4P6P086_9GAMM|nr:nucleotidyltransferase family protein [Litorilituus sediminis]QBG34426.1 nucleotidyltransferase family protein [Litorilituus sediminis]